MPEINIPQGAQERLSRLVELYNQAREKKDKDSVLRWGNMAVQEAKEQLRAPGIHQSMNASFKQYCEGVVQKISSFLENPIFDAPAPAGGGDAESEAKIKSTDWFAAPIPDLSLQDIAGLQDVKDAFMVNIFAALDPKYADIYQKYRGEERGLQVLLYGPPGTGKTFSVKCLAGQLNCKIAVVQIKDVMANLVGDGAKIVAEIFEQGKQYDNCIIFFDEIDAIASTREGDDSRHTKEQLTTLLTYMDGFTSKTKPGQTRIVIAATNRPWALDSAVKRGGRFDTQIYIPLPDEDARKPMINRALGRVKGKTPVPCEDSVFDKDWLVKATEGYAGADIMAICRQAVSMPLKREIMSRHKGAYQVDCVKKADFEEAMDRYINPTTVDDLMRFEAYSENREYDFSYIPYKAEELLRYLFNEQPIKFYERDWLKGLYNSGYITETFGDKYDLRFLDEYFQ